jgi:hypothetical protein
MTESVIKESFAEIRNAHISGMFTLGKLRDGKKTEVSAITELATYLLRIGVALKNLQEVGL